MAFLLKNPKRDQNLQFTTLSETTSIPVTFIWESPPPGPRPLHFLHIGKSLVYVTIYLLVKILFLTFKAYYKIGPKYLTDTLIKYMPSRKLRSASKELLVVVVFQYLHLVNCEITYQIMK